MHAQAALATAAPSHHAGTYWTVMEYTLAAVFLCIVVCAGWCRYVRSLPPSEYVEIQAMGMHDTLPGDLEPPASP